MNDNEKIIFESKTAYGYNIIIEKDDCYVLRAKKGEAIFDKDPVALDAVLSAIEIHGNAVYAQRKGFYFFFPGKQRRYDCALGQLLYCAYNKLSLDDLSGRLLKYVDGNPFNIRKKNVIVPHKQTIEQVSILGKQYILLRVETVNHECHYAVADNVPGLAELLSSLSWHYHKKCKCFRATASKHKYLLLHHVIWIFLHDADTTIENLSEKVSALQLYMRSNNLSIDHKKASASGERWDDRLTNLQLIIKKLNSSKGDLTASFHNDQFYIPTTNGEMYGRYNWIDGSIDLCENTGDPTVASIDQLRRFSKTGEFETTDTYCQIPLGSPKAAEIQLADLHETKLYLEILIYEH